MVAWLAAGLLGAAAARPAFASGLDRKLSGSVNYESGKYGTATRSSSLYVPFTLKRYWGDWFASLTLPFVSQTSDGQVTSVGGAPVRIRRAPGTAATTRTESGLGDALVRGGYALLKEDPQPFDLSVAGKVKVPTASTSKGLGTGQFDEGLGLESAKLLRPDWTGLADLYYTFIGSPPGTHLNNRIDADVGFSHPLGNDLTLTVLLEGSNALVSGEASPLDVSATVQRKLNERSVLYVGALAGLTSGSPDYGFSFGGSLRF